jgi:hypothetical protein
MPQNSDSSTNVRKEPRLQCTLIDLNRPFENNCVVKISSLAASTDQGAQLAVEPLVRGGADVNSKNPENSGKGAIHLAAFQACPNHIPSISYIFTFRNLHAHRSAEPIRPGMPRCNPARRFTNPERAPHGERVPHGGKGALPSPPPGAAHWLRRAIRFGGGMIRTRDHSIASLRVNSWYQRRRSS